MGRRCRRRTSGCSRQHLHSPHKQDLDAACFRRNRCSKSCTCHKRFLHVGIRGYGEALLPQAVSYPDTIVGERHRHSSICFINPVAKCYGNINADSGFANAHCADTHCDEDFRSDSIAHVARGYINRSCDCNTHPDGCAIGDTIAHGNTGADVYADANTVPNTDSDSAALELHEHR